MSDLLERLRTTLVEQDWSVPVPDLHRRVQAGVRRRRRARRLVLGAAALALVAVGGGVVAVAGLAGGDRSERPVGPVNTVADDEPARVYAVGQLQYAHGVIDYGVPLRWFGDYLPNHTFTVNGDTLSMSDRVAHGQVAGVEEIPAARINEVTGHYVCVDDLPCRAVAVQVDVVSWLDVVGRRTPTDEVMTFWLQIPQDTDVDRLATGLREMSPMVVLLSGTESPYAVADSGGGILSVDSAGRLSAPVLGHAAGDQWFRNPGVGTVDILDDLTRWLASTQSGTSSAETGP